MTIKNILNRLLHGDIRVLTVNTNVFVNSRIVDILNSDILNQEQIEELGDILHIGNIIYNNIACDGTINPLEDGVYDILLEKYNPFSIFVCADMESKIQRCINRMSQEEKKTIKAIENEIKAIDKTRAKTRELICENKWGDRSDYNLIINTTGWNLKDLSQSIAPVISKWFEVKNEN